MSLVFMYCLRLYESCLYLWEKMLQMKHLLSLADTNMHAESSQHNTIITKAIELKAPFHAISHVTWQKHDGIAVGNGECGGWVGPLRWRHNGRDGVSNHQPHDCLLNRLFRHRSKKTPKLRVTGLCVGDRWIPRTKGQLRGKCFHLMTSLCNINAG